MRHLRDAVHALDPGLAAIRGQFQVPDGFSPEVTEAAAAAARRRLTDHVDLTAVPFLTLDPASSTDLDQALHIERVGTDLLLHYAIADVGWFVDHDGPLDREAWRRGTTFYLPDAKAPLYPPALAEAAASLLPDGPRPAVVFHVRLDAEGNARLDGATRAVIRSRAKLAYDAVTEADLPEPFGEFARRVSAAESARGAAKIDPPEQLVERAEGGYRLAFRPRLWSETANAALSLACNLAVADALQAAGTGLFRVMDAPEGKALRRLRHTAQAFGLQWPTETSLDAFGRTLDPTQPSDAAFMMAVRRAGGGASYVPYREGVRPWHAAMAATYAHATAPLRRLADRYVVQAALAVANGREVAPEVSEAFARLPEVMERADTLASRIERAVVDLAEAVMLHGHEGSVHRAVVVDDNEEVSRIQLCDLAVVANLKARGVQPGDEVRVRLVSADPTRREVKFERVA
ncbi:MAG TPA: RNB domain-containing ribonuclease [Acidimicrobiaceae bacterium]|nr:RNB domain-containing ribonuclease [Acidimicrobiaceae bacterium]